MGEERVESNNSTCSASLLGLIFKRKSREIYVEVSLNGGFPQKPWVFLLKMIISGWRLGVPPFKETPIWRFIWLCKICTPNLTKGWI